MAMAPSSSAPPSLRTIGEEEGAIFSNGENLIKVLRSILKKPFGSTSNWERTSVHKSKFNARRKVQWTDSHGKELTQVLQFDPSDDSCGSDDEEDRDSGQACACVIQ